MQDRNSELVSTMEELSRKSASVEKDDIRALLARVKASEVMWCLVQEKDHGLKWVRESEISDIKLADPSLFSNVEVLEYEKSLKDIKELEG